MQAVRMKNRNSLHSIRGFILKTGGSLSFGKVDHFRKRQPGSFSFGISTNILVLKYLKSLLEFQTLALKKSAKWCTLWLEEIFVQRELEPIGYTSWRMAENKRMKKEIIKE